MNQKLFIGNILYEVTSEDLKALFSEAGEVVDAVVIMDRGTGRSKGFGFVEMKTAEQAKKAIETYNAKEYEGRKMFVSEARPKKENSEFTR